MMHSLQWSLTCVRAKIIPGLCLSYFIAEWRVYRSTFYWRQIVKSPSSCLVFENGVFFIWLNRSSVFMTWAKQKDEKDGGTEAVELLFDVQLNFVKSYYSGTNVESSCLFPGNDPHFSFRACVYFIFILKTWRVLHVHNWKHIFMQTPWSCMQFMSGR